MKISKFVPIFSILFLALIAATDFVLYNEVDASDAEGFTLLISLQMFL